tara:strand:- start:2955 stop:3917 length:963 start_codon:yes stop_codon:yes gene_type:complete
VARARKSRNHHWWPVTLQKHWTDRQGNLHWIEPDGTVDRKKAKNRKIGYSLHGHTIFQGTEWESNFEKDFEIDNDIPNIIGQIQELKPFGRNAKEFFQLLRLFTKKDRKLKDMCKFYRLEEDLHRKLLLFIFSLLIRSPASRSRYESYPQMLGLPPNENVGKGNMSQSYHFATKLCKEGFITNQFFVLLHSPIKKFVFGDGCLDWLTSGLTFNSFRGKALVPLTPHICIYFCTPTSMTRSPNCASFSAAPWMVERINQITQIYSKDKIFFHGSPPEINEAFKQKDFLEHTERTDSLIDLLDELAGNRRSTSLVYLGLGTR